MAKQGYDPADMELRPGHFSEDAKAAEESFRKEFDTSVIPNQQATGGEGEEGKGDDKIHVTPTSQELDYGLGDQGAGEGDQGKGADGEGGEADSINFEQSLKDSEAEELRLMNQQLGTDFESMNDLKAALKQTEKVEKNSEIDKDRQYVEFYDKILQYSDADAVRQDLYLKAKEDPKQMHLPDDDIKETIENEIARLTEDGYLGYVANSVRAEIRNLRKERADKVAKFEAQQKMSEQEIEQARTQKLQESVNKIFKEKKFLGITPTKEDMLKVYLDVKKNKHVDRLMENPDIAVEFELFRRYRDVIVKNLGKPDFNAGVKSTLEKMGMTTSSPGKNVNVNDNEQGDDDRGFIQKFLQ